LNSRLLSTLGARSLYAQIERIWGDKPHLSLPQLWLYLQSFVYLPRLVHRDVLIAAVRSVVGEVVAGPFAYAEFYDEAQDCYHGLLRAGYGNANIAFDADCVLVKADIAEHYERARIDAQSQNTGQKIMTQSVLDEMTLTDTTTTKTPELPTNFCGSVNLAAPQLEREVRALVAEILEPILRQPQAEIAIELKITANIPTGINDNLKRTLNENATQLKFTTKSIH